MLPGGLHRSHEAGFGPTGAARRWERKDMDDVWMMYGYECMFPGSSKPIQIMHIYIIHPVYNNTI